MSGPRRDDDEDPEGGIDAELDAEIDAEVEAELEAAGLEGDTDRTSPGWDSEVRRAAREARRAAHRVERDALRDARRAVREAEREARRQGRRTRRLPLFGGTLTIETDAEGREESQVVERRFELSGAPWVRVRNVSGETTVAVGDPGEVLVHARKRVHGWSEDRAKRLLENVEVKMEQDGDRITIEPRLYEQERGWLDLFRGGRVAVDILLTVPRETQVEATTVSGPLSVTGTRGPLEGRSVSGEISIEDVQGPMRIRTVSGDLRASGYAGQLEANSVSGDLRLDRSQIRRPDVVTVSGDVHIEGGLMRDASDEAGGRIKTVSGDVELTLAESGVELEFHSLSGDLDVDVGKAKVEKIGRREWHVSTGQGGTRLKVKTVSGDLSVRRSAQSAPSAPEAPAEEPMPMGVPAASTPSAPDVLDLLQKVASGELSVEDASAQLDQRRG